MISLSEFVVEFLHSSYIVNKLEQRVGVSN